MTKFPHAVVRHQEKLARMPADFLYRLRTIATSAAPMAKKIPRARFATGFLHDLGIALNYKNDPRLRFAYVLKPEWVTKGIYALLHAFIPAEGSSRPPKRRRFSTGRGIRWKPLHFLLGLMERFELSFPLPARAQQILIRKLLDDQQPPAAFPHQPNECLRFGYRYAIVPGDSSPASSSAPTT